jgi:hypothetical protein
MQGTVSYEDACYDGESEVEDYEEQEAAGFSV